MSVTSFTKAGNAVTRHGNKAAHFVSLGMIAWLTATFAGKDSFSEHVRQSDRIHEECSSKRSRQWQKIADLELAIERLRLQTPRMGELPQWTTTNQSVRVSE